MKEDRYSVFVFLPINFPVTADRCSVAKETSLREIFAIELTRNSGSVDCWPARIAQQVSLPLRLETRFRKLHFACVEDSLR